jgi:hypothetical protein
VRVSLTGRRQQRLAATAWKLIMDGPYSGKPIGDSAEMIANLTADVDSYRKCNGI